MENTQAGGVERQDQFTYALAQISEFQSLIRFADTKAGAAITVVSGLLAVLLAAFGSVPRALALPPTAWQFWLAVLGLLLSICFFLAFMRVLYFAFLTFLPRLEKREYGKTLAFFFDVYTTGEDAFIESVGSMTTDDLLEHLLREVFLLSEILVHKFKAQRLCFNWLRFVLVFWSAAQITILFIP